MITNRSRSIQVILDIKNKHAKVPLGAAYSVIGRIMCLIGAQNIGAKFLMSAIRYSNNESAIKYLVRNMPKLTASIKGSMTADVTEREALLRTIILSFPQYREGGVVKGVMLITFTRTCAYYVQNDVHRKLDPYFVFILEPSWAGYADPDLLIFYNETTNCYLEATEIADRVMLNALDPRGIALSFGAGNWVNDDIFRPIETSKVYDSIYVANMNPAKRVYRYIDAIKNIVSTEDPDYKGILVCASWGSGSIVEIEQYIRAHGLDNNIELSAALPQNELMKRISASKVSILLSLKEGSSRILFESMMLDVPVICLSQNTGVNKSYINEFTGLLVSDGILENALVSMKQCWQQFEPRRWAVENISPKASTKALSNFLEMKLGSACNTNIFEKVNIPEVQYRAYAMTTSEVNRRVLDILEFEGDEFWRRISRIEALVLDSHID